jgi:hypothetical protein
MAVRTDAECWFITSRLQKVKVAVTTKLKDDSTSLTMNLTVKILIVAMSLMPITKQISFSPNNI